MKKALTTEQQSALQQVIGLMRSFDLSLADVKAAHKTTGPMPTLSRADTLIRLFVYLGGTLIFAGLGVFIETIWNDLDRLSRVIVTFGPGFVAFILGILFANDPRLEKAATPAFIVSFLLQPTGLFVYLDEYFKAGDAALGGMVVFGLMALQQGLTFSRYKRPALLLFTLFFITGFMASLTEYYDIDRGLSSLMLGVFLFFITVDIQKRVAFKDLTPLFYIVSTGLFYAGLYYFIGRTVFDPLALSVIFIMLAYAVIRESKTLYVLSVLYLGGYFCGGPGGGWWMGWHSNNELAAIFTGASLVLAGHWVRSASVISLYPLWMFVGTGFALSGAYGLVYDTPFEALFAGIAVLGIYASLLLQSRAVLAASVLSLIGFIVSFSARYFAHTVGWPILLMLIGILILLAGFLFARLSGRIKLAAAA